jgi:hypothetical protein
MHNKISDSIEVNHGNRSIRKSKSTSNLSMINKKKMTNIKIEVDVDETNKSSPTGKTSPNHRRRPKRSSINNNSLLSTVTSVHELMSFIIHKDDPPAWLKQTELFKEYSNKSQQMTIDNNSEESPPHYHQQLHRKQRCNLQMYARTGQSWQSLPSPPLKSPTMDHRWKTRNHSNESIQKLNISPIHSSIMDFSTPLNISIKQDPIEDNSISSINKSKISKQQTRRQQMLCKKKMPQNGLRRRQRMNSVENQEPLEKKDSTSSSSSSSSSFPNNSNTSISSSIEHTSPSPTTTVSGSSSQHSSPAEYMRGTRLSSPLRIQTSLSPQRRSTRIWAPSNFYINPMWIIPSVTTTTTTTTPKRLLVQNPSSPSPPPPPSSSESNKRPRRQCRS